MIINQLEKAFGVVTTEDILEGRMVLLCSHSENYNFGGRTDLPGVKLPTNSTEAANAKYLIGFAQTNEQTPIIHPTGYTYALRYGFDQTDNTPFSATVYTTNPSVQDGLVIPSGTVAVAYSEGIFTVSKGYFVYTSDIENPGAGLTVSYYGSNIGKLKYGTSNIVAEVIHYNSDTYKLTFRLL